MKDSRDTGAGLLRRKRRTPNMKYWMKILGWKVRASWSLLSSSVLAVLEVPLRIGGRGWPTPSPAPGWGFVGMVQRMMSLSCRCGCRWNWRQNRDRNHPAQHQQDIHFHVLVTTPTMHSQRVIPLTPS